MNKSFYIIGYIFIIIFLITTSSVAQSGPPPPPDGGSGPGSVDDIPINMYWLVLLIVGAYFGIRNRMND